MSAASTQRPILYGDLRSWALIEANSLQLLRSFPAQSVDAVVTDPPYAIGLGGEDWDGGGLIDPLGFQAFSADWAVEVKRVLKPGGHMVAFGSPRTFHRMVAGCEDTGLEIRDQLLWLHGRGVPKSRMLPGGISLTLKPAYEPILLARAPLSEKTAERNLEHYATGGLNVDACRQPRVENKPGYWPSHVVLSHQDDCDDGGDCAHECVVPHLDHVASESHEPVSRLFYAAKTSSAEREAGLEALPQLSEAIFSRGTPLKHARANVHPTVKPIEVMRWLVRLVVPPGGVVLDPFAGSGSTGCAAVFEGRRFIGIEREPRFVPIARARLTHWTTEAAATNEFAGKKRLDSVPVQSEAGRADRASRDARPDTDE
jgi:site-specific DNA-methyltransferase (adenine-specific)